MKFLISYNKYVCVSECVCVCLKLKCKSVFSLIPGTQQQTKFKHVLTQATESLVYVRVWKTIVLQILHKEKKTNVMYFLIICFIFNVFHCFSFIHKCHSQLYLHPSAKECSKLLKQCLCVCVFVCICFLRLITRGRGTQQWKLILGTEYLHNEDSATHFDSLSIQFVVSRYFSERFQLASI